MNLRHENPVYFTRTSSRVSIVSSVSVGVENTITYLFSSRNNATPAAKKEWSEIDLDLLKRVGSGGLVAGASVAVSALTTVGLSLALPATGFAINAVSQLVISRMKRQNFRKSVPMSAFLDLERSG